MLDVKSSGVNLVWKLGGRVPGFKIRSRESQKFKIRKRRAQDWGYHSSPKSFSQYSQYWAVLPISWAPCLLSPVGRECAMALACTSLRWPFCPLTMYLSGFRKFRSSGHFCLRWWALHALPVLKTLSLTMYLSGIKQFHSSGPVCLTWWTLSCISF